MKKIRANSGLSQADFAAQFGVSRATQTNYETDKNPPDANYLTALHRAGHDITYILTGEMQSDALSADEAALIHMFRRVDPERQAVVLSTLRLMAPGSSQIEREAPMTEVIHDHASNFHAEKG